MLLSSMKVAIIEDEKREQEVLRAYFSRLEDVDEVITSLRFFNTGDDFLDEFEFGKFDLILMDIDLNSRINGIETSQRLRKIDDQVILIFMTNLAQYAIEGYKVKAFDYIVKPISYFDFSQRMKIIYQHVQERVVQKIIIPNSDAKMVVNIKDIYYVEVNNHSLIYHTANGNIVSSGTLKQALNELGKYHFAQCNNCYLVNLAYVMEVNGYEVMVKGENLLISHPRKKAFLQELSRYLGQ
ncbi:DNA-binding response regulator [Treponema rectale]|uniref:DNA-binding response regulator n=1 Tax=Treponema rectale TaxID=744512 RepID=A0A7M1XKK1_9SPIR|nr:DNA-binding response regulator [Treponema rectale]